ncbi:MAG: hypothetical protein EOM40_13610 [Clostridia bacterium]|nr:hypothetical protein [Clostridia bacterium]NCC43527.1 hypothetical protein [Clostridia bacterium]
MTYLNGKEILPEELLRQVQRYCAGGLLYIPKEEGTRQVWGARTGIKEDLHIRNNMIREKKKNGSSIKNLAEEYHLSIDSLKKILYGSEAKEKTKRIEKARELEILQ